MATNAASNASDSATTGPQDNGPVTYQFSPKGDASDGNDQQHHV